MSSRERWLNFPPLGTHMGADYTFHASICVRDLSELKQPNQSHLFRYKQHQRRIFPDLGLFLWSWRFGVRLQRLVLS